MTHARSVLMAAFAAVAVATAHGESISVPAAADNTLFEDFFGGFSNGAGDFLFAGTTLGGDIRRGLIRFDLSSIPASATINSVALRLHMSRTTAGTQNVTLHRALASWGEGASNAEAQEGGGTDAAPGDATWLHRFFSTTSWTTPGGDFSAVASATRAVSGPAFYTWGTTPQMVSDVQGWVNGSVQNSGWVLKGNESTTRTAKRFDSRTNFEPGFQPSLTVDFTRVPEPASALALSALALVAVRRR